MKTYESIISADYICQCFKQSITKNFFMDNSQFEIIPNNLKNGFAFFYKHNDINIKLPITCSIMKNGTVCRIRIKNKYRCYFENVIFKTTPKDEWSKIDCDIHDTDFIKNFDVAFSVMFSDLNKKDIGCCSHYLECSDAKKCVSDNPEIFLHCYYKTNLDNGKIFYGINKTM